MDHYIAYHSTSVMGRPYGPASGRMTFWSNKAASLLRRAIGSCAWVIVGTRAAGSMRYELAGVYTVEDVLASEEGCTISGTGRPFRPPHPLNSAPWFASLLAEQNNFSFGFNRVRDSNVVSALEALLQQTPALDDGPARGRASPELAELCVYTIASRERLDPVALEGDAFVSRESRKWQAALQLLEDARKSGTVLPILFADAKDCSQLVYWGLLEKIEIGPGETEYTVDRLRVLTGGHAPQELVLRSTGKTIAPGFIRPYAICHTPDFLPDLASYDSVFLSPEEALGETTLLEGGVMRVLVNAYERNPEARRMCIEHHGCRCAACGFDFAAFYGDDLGRGYIQVHHLIPLAERAGEYKVDPARDLRPVCPNCHAMIHRRKPPLTIEGLRSLLNHRRAGDLTRR